ncbi:MAG TPA: CPBP family intramembrane glutamic endopeptidase [Bacteroidales bacterium]|nr:CPBP family intramembrane glutamic endopeptidase [Bacteroidales bacterium]
METSENQTKRIIAKSIKLAETMPFYLYVPIAYILLIALFIPTFYLEEYLNLPETDYSKLGLPENIWFRYLIVAILSPLLETFLFQAMPYYFLNLFEFMKRHAWLTILLPGMVFGSFHFISVHYFIAATIMGMVFQFTYHIRSKKGDPFLSTYLLHALLNGMSITMQFFI